MPVSTKISRPSGAGQSRFARSASTPRRASGAGQSRFARSSTTPRRNLPGQGLRRRQQEPTGFKKALSTVIPSGAAKKAAPSSKKGIAGGLALVAAAAGMAFKNRGKLSELRHKDSHAGSTGFENSATPPSTPTI